MVSDEEVEIDTGLFVEPHGYYEPEKPETYVTHTLLSGAVLKLRLVGHNPLWVMTTIRCIKLRKLRRSRDTYFGTPDGWCHNSSTKTPKALSVEKR